MSSAFAAAMDKIVADCNDRLEWVKSSKDNLTKDAARVLIEQWSSFTRHSRQCWAYVVGNCPHVEVRKFVVTENLYEEEAQEGHSHFEILARMGMALGLTRDQIVNATPLPTTVVSMRCWEALTKNRTWYEGLAAKSVLERTNNPNAATFPTISPNTGCASWVCRKRIPNSGGCTIRSIRSTATVRSICWRNISPPTPRNRRRCARRRSR